MEYRKLTDLTDEEISIIIKEIFPNTRKVDHIERDENANFPLSCDIYIMEEYPDYADTLDLSPPLCLHMILHLLMKNSGNGDSACWQKDAIHY